MNNKPSACFLEGNGEGVEGTGDAVAILASPGLRDSGSVIPQLWHLAQWYDERGEVSLPGLVASQALGQWPVLQPA